MKSVWRDSNRVVLLENGEEFFPRVFDAIDQARNEILIETYILFDDPIGRRLRDVLAAAGRRGVVVDMTVDGHGSAGLTHDFIASLTNAGVRFHIFDPQPKLFGMRTNPFRRLHRKQIVIDGAIAFVGGLNFSHDHLREFGAEAKQDYAVEVSGPIVQDVRRVLLHADQPRRWWQRPRNHTSTVAESDAGSARAMLVTRDNRTRRNDIERQYREALRAASREIIIANAYFFPGYRFLKDLRNAARRGVAVRLILQGNSDEPLVSWASGTLYDYLLRSGVKIYKYCERPFHGKVALVDDDWATVGSSNLDPVSLSLNLEANLFVQDRVFTARLRERLEYLIAYACEEISPQQTPPRTIWRQGLNVLIFHFLRRFPAWGDKLPAQTVTRKTAAPAPSAVPHPPTKQAA